MTFELWVWFVVCYYHVVYILRPVKPDMCRTEYPQRKSMYGLDHHLGYPALQQPIHQHHVSGYDNRKPKTSLHIRMHVSVFCLPYG